MAYEAWRVRIELTPGVWTDFTDRVDTVRSPIIITSGDTAEASGDTGSLSLALRNHDQDCTPGNVLSTHYPNLTNGKRIWVTEEIADQHIDLFLGYIKFPEAPDWTPSSVSDPREQTITITAVDRIAQVFGGRKFLSTVAAHIVGNRGSALQLYLPLGESASPAAASIGTASLTPRTRTLATINTTADPQELASLTWGGGTSAPGDDLAGVRFEPCRDSAGALLASTYLQGDVEFSLASGQVCTVVTWVNPAQLHTSGSTNLLLLEGSNSSGINLQLGFNASGLLLGIANAVNGNWIGDALATETGGYDRNFPVAFRFGIGPGATGTAEMWMDDDVIAGSMLVTAPSTVTGGTLKLGQSYNGAISHLQLYVGDAADWTHDDFLAQRNVGLRGLDRQTTGERIRTILRYAGIPETDLQQVDDGVSVMRPVQLAGRGPGDAVAEAIATEQGLLYADGLGRPVFADRIRLLNI